MCKHILDCKESNLPSLVKSRAAFYTETIKLVCPRLFSISRKDNNSLLDEMNLNSQISSIEFSNIKTGISNKIL